MEQPRLRAVHTRTAGRTVPAGVRPQLRAVRRSTQLGYITDGGLKTSTTLLQYSHSYGFSYLDSPATTSATIYKTEFFEGNALSSVTVQEGSVTSTMILLEIGA